MFRANFQRTGVYKTSGVRQLRGLQWKFRQSPTIAGWNPAGERFVVVEDGVVCEINSNGNVYGLDSQTGQQLWTCQLGVGKQIFFPGIAEGVVYIGSRQLDGATRNQYLYAIDVRSGQQKWQLKLPVQPSSLSVDAVFSTSAPAIANGVTYIGGSDGNLYAVDVTSGELIWSFKTTKNMALTSPAVDKDVICVCSRDGYLYAIDLNTKQQRWKFEIGAMPLAYSSVPAISNQRVYITSSDNALYALNLQTGQQEWTFQAGNFPLYAPAIAEQIVCVGSGEGLLYALDMATGEPMWTFRARNKWDCYSPIIADKTIYTSSQGLLQALDLETGRQLWQFEMPLVDQWLTTPRFLPYALINQLVNVFTKNTFSIDKFSAPAIANGTVYVCCSNGYLYALH